ncbi:MAG: FAD-containing oxidoreductase [Bryobacteraceae bacterium]|nr:FAD-containing oxidoreductase [Bryobacteraceae bacterium]
MTDSYDALIIGTGQAGPSLAGRLAGAGMKVAIVERGRFGGTCVNVGCIPTKAMVASAYVAQMARRALEYGVVLPGPIAVDMKRVKARKDAISGRSQSGVEGWLKGMANCTVYQGHARFIGPRRVVVGETELTAARIFVNVGGRPHVPAIPGLQDVGYLTSDTMMDLDVLPRHLIVVGGGYVGLEFAQMFRRFGSAVTVLDSGARLLSKEDLDVSHAVSEILTNEGVSIVPSATVSRLSGRKGSLSIEVEATNGHKIEGSHLLIAIGRVPNTDDLGLAAAGISTDSRGFIPVDDQLRTSADGVWALGDCNGRGAFTHTAYNDFEIVAANLLDSDPRRVTDRIETYGLFIDPPLARVGMTESEALATGRKILVGRRAMTRIGRAIEKGETQGFMKVVVDAESKHILGAAILGTGGDEAIHSLIDIMYAGKPYSVIQRAVHIHPTVAELIPTVLGDLRPAVGQES